MSNNLFNYWKALLTQTRDAYNDCAIFIDTNDINLNLKTVQILILKQYTTMFMIG